VAAPAAAPVELSATGAVPTDSYLICATPRTGSYLLCDALATTGVAGRPTEYLMPRYRGNRMAQWEVETYRDFHDRVLGEGTSPNGVFGAKLHAAQLVEFLQRATGRARVAVEDRRALVEAWFPRPRYIWLRRRDQVAQGVSWAKACQTRVWWDSDVPPAPPVGEARPDAVRFDFGFIERSMYSLAEWDGVWRTYFHVTGIEPLVVWYEDLVADCAGTVRRVLDYLGLSTADGWTLPPPAFRRQADDISALWRRRYERLEAVKREATFAALAGLYGGETIWVCSGRVPVERVPTQAVTISVDGAVSPAPASFALLTRAPASTPAADVVVTVGRLPVDHPYVVPCLLDRRSAESPPSPRPRPSRLVVGAGDGPTDMAVALARHLGADAVERVGS
jgi:LPS sulfotransferase NodH